KWMDRSWRAAPALVLEPGDRWKKLLGMQLLLESLALTIFQVVRETRVEPVLAELLRYYEKDEARHVGLGVQLLPRLIRGLSKRKGLALFAFQMRIYGWALGGLKSMEPSLRTRVLGPNALL